MKATEMITLLKAEKINTWFDLGLFIDRFRGRRELPQADFAGSFNDFKKRIRKGGMSFITFYYAVDGVTIEITKYAKALKNIMPDMPVHFIGGEISEAFIAKEGNNYKYLQLKEICGFDSWPLYKDFFFKKLERGNKDYNALLPKFWKDIITICEQLGGYIEKNNIRLLYLVNTNSNPGNVTLAAAITIISEYLRIPVINNNHDFYWEGGNKEIDIITKGIERGPRDFFFKNSHLGEFFSQIDVFYPWDSRSWVSVNINQNQTKQLIELKGHNPANVCEIGTAVDTDVFTTLSKRDKINTFIQLKDILSGYSNELKVYTIEQADKELYSHIDNETHELPVITPFITGYRTDHDFDFMNNNIVFLQPTRIVSRKRIEFNFVLIQKLFESDDFIKKFEHNKLLNLTLIVTGPIPYGQFKYFKQLMSKFGELLESVTEKFRERIYLGFLFSEFDKPAFRSRYSHPLGIPKLYNIASLIMLPSDTEGRGLPVIEAVASGIPIFCRRYYPENVYKELIGEDLPEKDRLRVLEFDNDILKESLINKIIENIFYPQNHINDIIHNRKAVEKRFSINALQRNIENILYRLYLQLWPPIEANELCIDLFEKFHKIVNFSNEDFEYLIDTKQRHYLPGFGRLEFMIYLKSLIDPSFFRVEEHQMKGMVMKFAKHLIEQGQGRIDEIPKEILHLYYNAVDYIFHHKEGENDLRHDHSLSYRHRNKEKYPYRSYTFQELTGLINLIYEKIIPVHEKPHIDLSPHFFTDWNLALFQLTNSSHLAIDDRYCLMNRLKENVPIAYFPGRYMQHEIEFFVLQPIRARLMLKIEEELTEEIIKKNLNKLEAVYIFMHEKSGAKWFSVNVLENHLKTTDDRELKLLYKYRLCKIVKTRQLSVGIHFNQLGEEALNIMTHIKNKNGYIIANGENAPIMTDIVDLDRFHIGKIMNVLNGKMMGIPMHSGYIQFVPAAVRTILAYPTPIQTSKDFSDALKSDIFTKLKEKFGRDELFKLISEDARKNGTPIKKLLKSLQSKTENKSNFPLKTNYMSGVYNDGLPWSGVKAELINSDKKYKWIFAAENVSQNPNTVTEIVKKFEKKRKVKTNIAWNGGYILNPELVGKLGLPETYIGSPLGLLISEGKVLCTPLFNKPAFIIYKNGAVDILKVNLEDGLTVSDSKESIKFHSKYYNNHSEENPCYYDLMYDKKEIKGNGNVIVRLASNVIKEVIFTRKKEKIKLIPVGITLSVPKKLFPKTWNKKEKILSFNLYNDILGKGDISYAIEAGPMLVDDSKKCIDMELEGWKTSNSIKTQAARLDFTDMRGPKIAVGIDKVGNIHILTVNGRIRESVGATHHDIAEIMLSLGMKKAMGFDPGGSSTLVVNNEPVNISPYNAEYEKDIYSLSPQPRAVSNAIIAWAKEMS